MRVWVALALGHLAAAASAASLAAGGGLALTFDGSTGRITAASIDGTPLPFLPGATGGLSLILGSTPTARAALALGFDNPGGPWTSAFNADWNTSASYATWIAAGGPGGGAHLRLGNGVAQGVGMACADPIEIPPRSTARIRWWARCASAGTTQILTVRLFDRDGHDVTAQIPAPPGWAYTGTSQALGVWGLQVATPGSWELFEQPLELPAETVSLRLSLRHWTGGDHWVDIDGLQVLVEDPGWTSEIPLMAPLQPSGDQGFNQLLLLDGETLRVSLATAVSGDVIALRAALEDLALPRRERLIQLRWTLPLDLQDWTWWDDLDTARPIAGGDPLRNTARVVATDISLWPLACVSSPAAGVMIGVPMSEPVAQRFEAAGDRGLSSAWDIGLSPHTAREEARRPSISLVVAASDPAWGFRSALADYQAAFPVEFEKRSIPEGTWLWPLAPSEIPSPEDFGFAHWETHPRDPAEIAGAALRGIGAYHYVEPWLAWGPTFDGEVPPTIADRVAVLEDWVQRVDGFANWKPTGGVAGSGHLELGDGFTAGAGMAVTEPFAIPGGETLRLRWSARVSSEEALQILGVRLYDSTGGDITASTPAPSGWLWTTASQAHVIPGLACAMAGRWEAFERTYAAPPGATSMRVSLRHWIGGDHLLDLDNLRVERVGNGQPLLVLDFDAPGGAWTSADNADWDSGGVNWLRVPRAEAAQAVLNSLPRGPDGGPLLDAHPYFLQSRTPGRWRAGYPLNPDPDIAHPNGHDLYREHWVLDGLNGVAGIYFDSITSWRWEDHDPAHLAAADVPLGFSWRTLRPIVPAYAGNSEFLRSIAAELRGRGKRPWANLFPESTRFHAPDLDLMGSEIFTLVEPAPASRLRRGLAGHRIVTNLLQFNWEVPAYATRDEVAAYLRGQLFWGFHPGVSSIGGRWVDGAPDRYFRHPELYERDRPLFRQITPIIRELGAAGWEPVTGARVTPAGETERFGDFTRGDVLFTVRVGSGPPLAGELAVDLSACGLSGEAASIRVCDLLASTEQTVSAAAHWLDLPLTLAPDEVRVFRLTALGAHGAALR